MLVVEQIQIILVVRRVQIMQIIKQIQIQIILIVEHIQIQIILDIFTLPSHGLAWHGRQLSCLCKTEGVKSPFTGEGGATHRY